MHLQRFKNYVHKFFSALPFKRRDLLLCPFSVVALGCWLLENVMPVTLEVRTAKELWLPPCFLLDH